MEAKSAGPQLSVTPTSLAGSLTLIVKLIVKAVDRSLDIYLKAIQNEVTAEPDDDHLLKIGQLAEAVEETVRTIRFWTGEGLLDIADKTASNYALYAPESIDRVRKIQALKKQRYTLREIRDLLD